MTTSFIRLASYLSQSYLLKNKCVRSPPLMFYWEIYEFFKIAEAANGGVL